MPLINLSLNLVKNNRYAVARDRYSCERRGPLASFLFVVFFLYKASSQEAVAMVILRNMV